MKKVKNKQKLTPSFQNEREESKFWETHDSTDFIDWSQAKNIAFPNLKPSTQSISLRLPVEIIESLKIEANKRDVPYQSLLKMLLTESLKKLKAA